MFITKRTVFRALPVFSRRCGWDRDESGSAMVVVLVILAILSLLGGLLTQSSTTELQIAGNDRLHKETFYAADGASELASELLEQNIACPTGFTNAVRGNIEVDTLDFWQNTEKSIRTPGVPDENLNLSDFHLPTGFTPGEPHTTFTVGGRARFIPGSAIQMAAAYEGKGKASGAGGAYLLFEIAAQRLGWANSRSIVRTQWRHVIGTEGSCIP